MKQLLIATAALSLIGGAAFAQTTGATPGAYASPGSTQGAQAGADPSTGTNDNSNVAPGATSTMPVNGAGSNSAMPSSQMPSAQTPSASDTSSTMPSGSMASNTPSGSPPSAYPVCTSKHEDRCVNRSQSTRMASNGSRAHHMKSMSSSSSSAPAASDQAQPAATPGL